MLTAGVFHGFNRIHAARKWNYFSHSLEESHNINFLKIETITYQEKYTSLIKQFMLTHILTLEMCRRHAFAAQRAKITEKVHKPPLGL